MGPATWQDFFLNFKRNNSMYEKKPIVFKSPDLNKLQMVVIDHRTKIYIPIGADPEEARFRYQARYAAKK